MSNGIVSEEIVVVLARLASVFHSSSGSCRLSSPVVTNMLYNISHHVLLIDIILNIDWLVHLLFFVNINILPIGVLWFEKFYTKESLVYLSGLVLSMRHNS